MYNAAFHSLSSAEIAQIVQAHGITTCSFAFNGTRRWFQLEAAQFDQGPEQYITAFTQRVLDICELLFAHGFTTVIMPVISPRVWQNRPRSYQQLAQGSLPLLFSDDRFLEFYEKQEIAAYLFGDFENYLPAKHANELLKHYSAYCLRRHEPSERRIFWGVCAHNSAETLSHAVVDFYKTYNQTPERHDLINFYYGDSIDKIDLHIGSGKPKLFDLPLVWTGQESLYFTVAPSPYFDERQLRLVLFDHIFARKAKTNYGQITAEQQEALQNHYRMCQDRILGVGDHSHSWGIWHAAHSMDEIRLKPEPSYAVLASHSIDEG